MSNDRDTVPEEVKPVAIAQEVTHELTKEEKLQALMEKGEAWSELSREEDIPEARAW